MEEKIKVSFLNHDYILKEKDGVVVCTVTYSIHHSSDNNIYDYFHGPYVCKKCVGVSHCLPEDVFDVEKGKMIARAKAENKAYKAARSYLLTDLKRKEKELNVYKQFVADMDSYIEHNDKYIKSLSE